MSNSILYGFEFPYKLYRRFEALIESVYTLPSVTTKLGIARYKPLFNSYNSCKDAFEKDYPEDYNQLNLEELPLYDEAGEAKFTQDKLSTLLHQCQAIVGVLRGSLPPHLLENPGGTSLVVLSQSYSQSTAQSSSDIKFSLIIENLSQVIKETKLEKKAKEELLADLCELQSPANQNESKIRAIASKLAGKTYKAGIDITSEVITKLILSQMKMPQ
jgi:hypothetical protein